MGRCLLVYDISNDRVRSRIADACLDYGLDRIQFSAFLGRLSHTEQEELMLKIGGMLGKRPGNVQLFPLCQRDWAERQVILQEPDEDDGQDASDKEAA